MLAVVSDTHGTDGARLRGRTHEAVREAEAVVHGGDFTTASVLDAFADAAETLHGVHGNSDAPAVRERLPPARTLSFGGVTVAVTHTRRGGPTELSLFGRERGADVVVFGHSHRPTVAGGEEGPLLLNPGSHADPRGATPAHAELERADGGVAGALRTPDGETLERFAVERRDESES